MFTRRSPKNQDKLFKILFEPDGINKIINDRLISLENQLSRCINKRTRGMIQREIAREKIKRATSK